MCSRPALPQPGAAHDFRDPTEGAAAVLGVKVKQVGDNTAVTDQTEGAAVGMVRCACGEEERRKREAETLGDLGLWPCCVCFRQKEFLRLVRAARLPCPAVSGPHVGCLSGQHCMGGASMPGGPRMPWALPSWHRGKDGCQHGLGQRPCGVCHG